MTTDCVRMTAALDSFPSASSAFAAAAVKETVSDVLNRDTLIARAADVAAKLSSADAATPTSATTEEADAAASAADCPAAYTSALIDTRVSTVRDNEPASESDTLTPSLLNVGDTTMNMLAPAAVSPDAIHEPASAPETIETPAPSTAPTDKRVEDAHVRANALAAAASAKAPPLNCVTFAFAAKNDDTF